MRTFKRICMEIYGYAILKIPYPFQFFYVANMYYDYKHTAKRDWKKVKWAHKRGFFYERVALYDLDESNYREYLSEREYYKMYPINENFSSWLDDKITIRYVYAPFGEFFPRYYFHIISNGSMEPIFNGIDSNSDTNVMNRFFDLLTKERALIMKKLNSSLSNGVLIVECDNEVYKLNHMVVKKEELIRIIGTLKDYMVEEYVPYNKMLPKDFDTIRLVGIRDSVGVMQLHAAYMDISCDVKSDYYFESILCDIDIESGFYSNAKRIHYYKSLEARTDCGIINTNESIQTGTVIEGYVPHWDEICSVFDEMFVYTPQIKYVGIDIIVTDDSFKVLEINSHQDLIFQIYKPAYKAIKTI